MTLDVELGRQQFLAAATNLEMDMRRPGRIRYGLDGTEQILPGASGGKPAEPLELLVLTRPIRCVAGVQVNPVGIALPNFHQRIAHRFSAGIEHPSAHIAHLTHRWGQGVVDDDQVIVGVQRQMVWIVGPLGGGGGSRQGLSEGTNRSEASGDGTGRPKEIPTRLEWQQ